MYSPGIGKSLFRPYVIYEDTTPKIVEKKWPPLVPSTVSNPQYQELQTAVYRNATSILTSNDLCRQSIVNDYGVSPEKVTTIYQGCNFEPVLRKESTVDTRRILFVGYNFHLKGGPVLLEAFRQVRQRVPKAQLFLVGPRLCLEQQGVFSLGRVTSRKHIWELLHTSVVFVLPSYFDAMPNAVLEAMGIGLPVIVSDSCGSAELITDRVNGLVVPTGNSDDLACKLIELLLFPDFARELGHAAHHLVRNSLTWDIVSQNLYAALSSAQNSHS
jgi:glycosyltransferase involved in cell wall biosynthesis